MRHIDDIDRPTWNDLFDRDSAIRKLTQEIDELRHDLSRRDARIRELEAEVKRKTALLGVP